ncbi:MAG: nucleotide exchange factor GrpE [Candidatus Latescibacterota bacterium]|nr:MAG: nucleotide exchange factor GrpE [Candidatus Latescibacterota bacterium]
MTDKKKQTASNESESERQAQDDMANDGAAGETPSEPAPVTESQPEKSRPSRKLTKKEILAHLSEKNEKLLNLVKQNKALEIEIKNLKDRWLRTAAEFENYRKRTRKEWDLLQQQAKGEVILEVLSVVDDFERAFSVVGDRDDDFVTGMQLILNNLTATLEKLGVSRIEALDSPFDPNYHMAVAHLEKEGAEPDHVIEIVQHGYLLGETVIRPAKVVIAK